MDKPEKLKEVLSLLELARTYGKTGTTTNIQPVEGESGLMINNPVSSDLPK